MSNYILPKSRHYLIQENMWMAAQSVVKPPALFF